MKPKEKAHELAMKFDRDGETDNAIQCAIIAVDEILESMDHTDYYCITDYELELFEKYWKEVKEHLQNSQIE